MIRLKRLDPSSYGSVAQLSVLESQVPYVGRISDLLSNVPNTSDLHAIQHDHRIVGFFILDTAYSDTYSFSIPGELGLRAFFIDAKHQGRGYGRSACRTLEPYLSIKYPSYPSIALTVNCKNIAAYKTYVGSGFRDIGELFYGGKAGPQNILRMSVQNSNRQ
ncbi:MAG: GNAT family N-acetyltransferase [Gammaproteobacteria bacterium]|jgi:RimJ/RimL family protein N-acetyltransferase